MKKANTDIVAGGALRNPLLIKLAEAAARFTGMGLIAVLPEKEGGQQVSLSGHVARPLFCRMIQGTPEGAKHCKICHVLMAVAASREGVRERRCHAGLAALISPSTTMQGNELVVLSTCLFVSGNRAEAWSQARERGLQLKLDLKRFREAFEAIPKLSPDKLELARAFMVIVAEAITELEARHKAEAQLGALRTPAEPKMQIQTELKQALKSGHAAAAQQPANGPAHHQDESCPILIKVVTDLIEHRPNLPYSVAAIAAAARITPSHFSALFRRWRGQSFVKLLNTKRVEAAKVMLRDPTLSISEVAGRAGYTDANYFARCFKQATHTTPHEWRNNLPLK
jgi:AraC-like DNA-binding protein/ligand-binding sensor protein